MGTRYCAPTIFFDQLLILWYDHHITMKSIIRSILFYSFSLFLLSLWLPGLSINGGVQTYLIGGAALTGINLIIKPIIHIVSLPVTILTLGLFSFIINAGILFLLTKVVPQIIVHAFTLTSYSYQSFSTPAVSFSLPLSFLFIAFMLSCLVITLQWITKE